MTDSDEKVQIPVAVGESMLPPTEIRWSVNRDLENLIALKVSSSDRVVNLKVLLNDDDADKLAEELKKAIE